VLQHPTPERILQDHSPHVPGRTADHLSRIIDIFHSLLKCPVTILGDLLHDGQQHLVLGFEMQVKGTMSDICCVSYILYRDLIDRAGSHQVFCFPDDSCPRFLPLSVYAGETVIGAGGSIDLFSIDWGHRLANLIVD